MLAHRLGLIPIKVDPDLFEWKTGDLTAQPADQLCVLEAFAKHVTVSMPVNTELHEILLNFASAFHAATACNGFGQKHAVLCSLHTSPHISRLYGMHRCLSSIRLEEYLSGHILVFWMGLWKLCRTEGVDADHLSQAQIPTLASLPESVTTLTGHQMTP